MMRDVRQCALRFMNGRVLLARHPAKQVSPHKHTRPVASHVTLFGLQLCNLCTNARSSLAFGCADSRYLKKILQSYVEGSML